MSPEPETGRFIAVLWLAYGIVVFWGRNTIFFSYFSFPFFFPFLLLSPFLVRHTVMTVMTTPAGRYDYDGVWDEKMISLCDMDNMYVVNELLYVP